MLEDDDSKSAIIFTNRRDTTHRVTTYLRKKNIDPASAACVTVSGNSMEPVLPDGSSSTVVNKRHLSAYQACQELEKAGSSRRENKKVAAKEIKRLQESYQPLEKLSKKHKKRLSGLLDSMI